MHSRLVAALVAALGGVSVFTDFFGVGWPAKAGALVVAVAVAYWLFRRQLPAFKDLLVVLLLATTIGLALGQIDFGDDGPTFYDFVVVPKRAVTVESAFPGPRHEARNSALFGYGEHVRVRCGVVGYDDKVWYALVDGNFMPESELVPGPLADGEPPSC